MKQGQSKAAYLAGKGWLPYWFGSRFNRRLLHKRQRQYGKDEVRIIIDEPYQTCGDSKKPSYKGRS